MGPPSLDAAATPSLRYWRDKRNDATRDRTAEETKRDARAIDLGPDLQNILRQSYDYLTIMPKLRSTYDRRLIHKTSYEGRKAFLRYNSLAKS